ncbi:MAG: translation initiation factor IF-2, partial [Cyanobacteria bacterium K_DeepCast_150m_m2_101]|nr:translation initiation factor IF-2 [Cyanobacteria bacterium K_DeepCast_150m_m2_101]
MTSSGKVRIYELSKDLGLENKDVLDAAEKLSISAKSHSSSISDDEAARIRNLIKTGGNGSKAAAPAPAAPPQKAILSVKKAPSAPAPAAPQAPKPAASAPAAPVKPAPAAPPAAAKPAAAKPPVS